MSVCPAQPNPGLYGLGVRLAFYIQWFGAISMAFLDDTALADVRLFGLLLSSAVALALVIQLGQDNLEPANIYVTLLLVSGVFIFLVPVYIWRAFSLCNAYWNPLKASRERPSPFVQMCYFALVVAVAGVGVWFYIGDLPDRQWDGCASYGFWFGRVSLDNKAYIAFNAILYLVVLIVCVLILFEKIGFWEMEVIFGRRRKRRHFSKSHRQLLNTMRALANWACFAGLVAAIELAIQYNELDTPTSHVDAVDTSAQLIPLVVSGGLVARSLFTHFVKVEDDESSDGGRHPTRRRPSAGVVREKVYRQTTVVDEEAVGEGPSRPPPTHRRKK